MRKKKKFSVLYIVIALIIALTFNAIKYMVLLDEKKDISFDVTNKTLKMGTINQDDYVLICEYNGISSAPFIFGGKLVLYSLEDGKRYVLADDKRIFYGISMPCIAGDMVYYFTREDAGGARMALYSLNLLSKEKRLVSQYNDMYDDIAINEKNIIYTQYDYDIEEEAAFFQYNDGERIKLTTGYALCVNIINDEIYCYELLEDETGRLTVFSAEKEVEKKYQIDFDVKYYGDLVQLEKQNGRLFALLGNEYIVEIKNQNIDIIYEGKNINSMSLSDHQILFSDDSGIYTLSLDGVKAKQFISFDENEELKALLHKNTGDIDMIISYCEHYIAVQTIYIPEHGMRDAYITTFDYDGKLVRQEHNRKLRF